MEKITIEICIHHTFFQFSQPACCQSQSPVQKLSQALGISAVSIYLFQYHPGENN
jgi:hypothetical protein